MIFFYLHRCSELPLSLVRRLRWCALRDTVVLDSVEVKARSLGELLSADTLCVL